MTDKPFLDAPAGADDVVAAYRWILGREPRSAAEAERLLAANSSRGELRSSLLGTKASLHEHLKHRFGPEKWVLAEIFDDLRIWLNLCDRHVSMGCLVGTWEPEETQFMRALLKPGQVVVDVGANIGWFSLVASRCVGRSGRVHAFEPQPRVFPYLARTIAENGLLGQIMPYRMALSDRWETLEMAWNPRSANMGHAWISRGAAPTGGLGAVRAGVLDDILGDEPIDFLKVDAEGAEALVLAGARRILERRRPAVMIEILPKFLEQVSGVGAEALFAVFDTLGYRGFELGPEGPGRPVETWPAGRIEMNVAFLPQ